ncbi:MAG: hypothetical protein GY803_17475 [Chloroflexi bacterium]|nr:hypothetical protein [Chloroflexota bacterium]
MKRRKQRKKTRKKGIVKRAIQSTGKSVLRRAGKWPLLECLISDDWRNTHELTQICLARQSPTGEVIAGAAVVDLGCLGVKNAFATRFRSAYEYRREMRANLERNQTLIACDLDLAAKVIAEAVRYAADLGFRPNKDLRDVLLLMGDARPENCATEIPLGGEDGQPFYFAGPYDNPERVMRILDRKVGSGNYHFVAPIGDPSFFEDGEGMTIEIDDDYDD